jgi:integrase
VSEGDAALLKKLAELLGKAPRRQGNMVALMAEFQAVHSKTLTFEVKKEYERMFSVLGKAFEDFDARQVTPADVIKFLNDNFADKPTTKRHYKARLSTFFSWCVLNQEHTAVRVNPCREIKLKAPPKSRGKMTAAVYWRIYDALSPMGQCFLELMYLTRQRPTEIRLLRESQIGPDRIHFRPTKTEESSGEEVDVLITPEIQAAIERARSLKPKHKIEDLAKHRDPFVIQTRDGDKYTKNGLYEVWRDACVAAGTRGVTTRHVRPFALHEMERLGYDVREIQKAAAHASITTTEGYLDQHRDRLSDARLPLPTRKT